MVLLEKNKRRQPVSWLSVRVCTDTPVMCTGVQTASFKANQSVRTNSFLSVSISTLVMIHLSTFIIKASWTVEVRDSFIYCKYRNVLFLNVGMFIDNKRIWKIWLDKKTWEAKRH